MLAKIYGQILLDVQDAFKSGNGKYQEMRVNHDKLCCPRCKNEEISIFRYSQRHGKTYGCQLNFSNCGKFLIIQIEKIKEKENEK